MARTTAQAVASYFVRFCGECGDPLTNLHLQKYLYYAQGWFLALYNEVLFRERLEAWVHGPVQPMQYRRFMDFGWSPIVAEVRPPNLDRQTTDHLIEIHNAYGRFSAWDLERMTHAESPWREARGTIPDDEPSKAVISPESMRRYFRGRLKAGKKTQ